jgi:hypothetical protein
MRRPRFTIRRLMTVIAVCGFVAFVGRVLWLEESVPESLPVAFTTQTACKVCRPACLLE